VCFVDVDNPASWALSGTSSHLGRNSWLWHRLWTLLFDIGREASHLNRNAVRLRKAFHFFPSMVYWCVFIWSNVQQQKPSTFAMIGKLWTYLCNITITIERDCQIRPWFQAGRIQPIRLGGGDFSNIWWSSLNNFATVREMKHTSQHYCGKIMYGKMAVYRECCFPNCTKSWWKGDRTPWIRPWFQVTSLHPGDLVQFVIGNWFHVTLRILKFESSQSEESRA